MLEIREGYILRPFMTGHGQTAQEIITTASDLVPYQLAATNVGA